MPLNFLSPQHALWLAGFRPFFTSAILMGIVLPISWGLIFSGTLPLFIGINSFQWHAHEMLFGFAGAVLFGFLLTASKNWVKERGIYGLPLIILVGLWWVERFSFYYLINAPSFWKHLGLSLFPLGCGAYIAGTLIKYRKQDNFKDNYFFLILLSLMVLAKNLLISSEWYQHGIAMTLGLYRLAFAVMFERTITQFMKGTENLELYRNPFLDFAIKLSVLLSAFQSVLPSTPAALILSITALLLTARWLLWKPLIGLRKFGNATMYLGYLGLILHFVFEALKASGLWSQGTISIHIFTFLCMGIVIPSMLVRIAQGHTGRKPQFTTLDKIAIFFIFSSAFFRLILPQLFPAAYTQEILAAGFLWSLGFLILSFRLIPFLFQPRIDGKVH